MGDEINMGGSASFMATTETHGVGVIHGFINGAAYGEMVSESREVRPGVLEYEGRHHFLDADGSSLRTRDVNTVVTGSSEWANVMHVAYTIDSGTGRFAGYQGTFHSVGVVLSGKDAFSNDSVGTVRFSGTISRPG
ncbi:hypothetical protein [Streptomyces sp. NPDC094472]|uniref:hypothetical protein n=1 Tax=Streptomyces sp. NPDC094472 TaxID=3155080 RepID=UPI0033292F2C